HRHEVVPGRQVTDKRTRVEASQFFFADREGNDRNVLSCNPLIAKLAIERDVGVTVDGGHHRGLLARRAEVLDVRNDCLPVGMTERRVVDGDILSSYALVLEVRLEDLVGRLRINVVGSGENPAL